MTDATNHSGAPLLPQTAEYALRAMVCLSRAEPDELVPRETLVEQAHLPAAYASKVLRKLVLSGLVEGRKGWHGGFRLARPAAEVRFLDVLLAVDCDPSPDHCAFGYGPCNAKNPCPLHDSWLDLRGRFRDWATQTTLADAGTCPDPIARRIGIPRA